MSFGKRTVRALYCAAASAQTEVVRRGDKYTDRWPCIQESLLEVDVLTEHGCPTSRWPQRAVCEGPGSA